MSVNRAQANPKSEGQLRERIPVSEPNLRGREAQYVSQCLSTGWISSQGAFIEKFEHAFGEFHQTQHNIAVSNGTTALHLALLALEVGPGDEVIVPTFTYIASVNAIRYVGATPVFVDCEPDTFNLAPDKLKACLSSKTKAVIAVHLYGHPCDMDAIAKVTGPKIPIIEDAAEAFGSEYRGRKVGSLSTISTFSFFGNKTITTGEGGMVCTSDENLAKKIRLLKGQGMSAERRYFFPVVGYNYRMTNVQGAIGLAQMESAQWFVDKKREIAKQYHSLLSNVPGVVLPVEKDYALNTYWMYSILVTDAFGVSRDELIKRLDARGIETRPFFYPTHTMPPYSGTGKNFPVAERISAQGLNLPSSTKLTAAKIELIAGAIRDCRSIK